MSQTSDHKFINIIGVPKNGKSLVASLCDNHEEISSFPLEIKFVDHYFSDLKKKSFDEILNFFLTKSKIFNLDNKNFYQDIINKKILTDNNYSPEFNLKEFEKIVKIQKNNLEEKKKLKNIIILLHNSLDIFFKKKKRKNILIQDGCYGLRYIEEQLNLFNKIKFVVVVRNPLDVYCDLKKIRQKFKRFRRNIYDICHVEGLKTKVENLNYLKLNKIYKLYNKNPNFIFLKYEELISKPEKTMIELANFLEVKYDKSLLNPTVFGKTWLDNSSEFKRSKEISNQSINIYKNFLNQNEINYLLYFNQEFYNNFKYTKYICKQKKNDVFFII